MRLNTSILVCTLTLSMAPAPLSAQGTGVREASASDRGLIQLNTRVRYTTMVVLPDGEDILDVVCGDKDFWIISAAQNIAHVKPAKEGAATNMNLVASSGTVYSFLLNESKAAQPDLKVYVTADPSRASNTPPKYYSVGQVSELQAALIAAKTAVVAAQNQADDAIASFRRDYPASMQFVYGTPPYKKPFFIRSIWHDGRFTYIRTDARELPVLYEVMDGHPSLLNFQVYAGTYVVPKVLDRGYLKLGKERVEFLVRYDRIVQLVVAILVRADGFPQLL
jgi:type IV secretion system protein VirB9